MNKEKIKIKPITNESEYKAASKIIDALIDADMIEDVEKRQKALEILAAITTLAIEYEKKSIILFLLLTLLKP
ncbi:hypothetical protein [Emticicia agri]|uniref:Uncharacterized protein n=1 Tax=Emticicia agri TaxID=2492393 RepID=A0A4Q5M3S0_9BACT|nr:hypothetical protein [Emticicia agri]RYU96952.1 hypothetical protein EWM59_03315 [Emticicia agri]